MNVLVIEDLMWKCYSRVDKTAMIGLKCAFMGKVDFNSY